MSDPSGGPGPGAPASRFQLFRDDLGVPHVRAGSETDLAYGQGYVTALDRGWQLEVDRWYGEGRLAARLGAAGLEWDRFAVRVRLADTARRVWDALAEPERAWLDAYAHGVQAGLDAGGRDTPERAELARALGGAPLPDDEPWRPWTPVGTFLVHHVLFSGFPHLLWREHVARTLGPALGDEALGWWGERGAGGPSSGSNAWALHGSRTASGAPLLAGDPHRLLELPGVYQQVRLARPGHDVVGLAFPGVPGVLHYGHAVSSGREVPVEAASVPPPSVAWGVTNAMAHHAELWAEGADAVEARSRVVVEGAEVVPVRGGDPVAVRWAETPRGPLVTDRHSLRWPVRVTADAGVAAWRALQRASTARDVAAAFAGWVDPVNRVLVADSTGEVLSLTAGRVPDVAPSGRVVPATPGPTPAAPVWRVLPGPAVVADVAVDANDRPARPEHDLGHAYAPHRGARVRALLADPPPGGETAAAQDRLLADTRDGGAVELVAWLGLARPSVEARLPSVEPVETTERAARLRAWVAAGARTDADDADAALFARWRHALVRLVAADPALAPLHDEHGLPAVFAPWLDVVARVGDALAAILASGVVDGGRLAGEALADLDNLSDDPAHNPADDAGETWGDLHRLAPLHALDLVPGATAPVVPVVPLGGAGDAVRCTGGVPGVTHAASRGSVARWVWDLGDRRRSRWGVPFGASGDPRSPYFADQHPAWAEARTTAIETEWARLRPEPLPTRRHPEDR
ncbi:penicillin acylase family protein [Krasilnikoviella flava]|uniref:Penicillin amidase n=1 Tax=Krasilnikoviella flava TaxID=526729 RepID=A0A1T5J9J9_9MICO|nr:penicillin acylase family protein [Krasilnikoviella flava]SKC47928.1 penicillin amidase [Krasilnikoviella flava]